MADAATKGWRYVCVVFVHDSAAYILISVRVKGANLRHIVQELFVFFPS